MIEEKKEGNLVRIPDRTQKELIEVINKHFKSVEAGSSDSRESIIVEIQNRMKPLIINLVRSIAWGQGQDIFADIANEKFEESIKKFNAEVKKIIDDAIKVASGVTIEYRVSSETKVLVISQYRIFSNSSLDIYVNGMIQSPSTYIVNTGAQYIDNIVLGDTITPNDEVIIKCGVKGA